MACDQHVESAGLAEHHPAAGQHRRLRAQELALAHAGHVGASGRRGRRGGPGSASTPGPQRAVRREAGVALEVDEGPLGLGSEDAVDPPGVEARAPRGDRWRSATSSPRSMGLRR